MSTRRIAENYQTMGPSASKPTSGGALFHVHSVALLIFVPWANFVISFLLFAFRAFILIGLAWLMFIFLVVISITWFLAHQKNKTGGPYYLYIGMLSVIALILGGWLGLFESGSNRSMWGALHSRQTYTNVPPTDAAQSKIDGGLISFTQDSWLDHNRVLGYQSANGHKYCVAPIFDESQQKVVNFWAVGVDCCGFRWGFDCGDARDPTAKSGVVYFDLEDSYGRKDGELFAAAARQASAVYGFSMPETPVFVSWVQDPEAWSAQQWVQDMLWISMALFAHLVFSIVVAALLHTFTPKKEADKQGMA